MVLLLTGCEVSKNEVKGKYKEGTYFGTYQYEYSGQNDVATSANIGVIPNGAEWYEQIAAIEAKIVAEQGIDWIKYDAEGSKLDGFSGATLKVSDLMKAVEVALAKAK